MLESSVIPKPEQKKVAEELFKRRLGYSNPKAFPDLRIKAPSDVQDLTPHLDEEGNEVYS